MTLVLAAGNKDFVTMSSDRLVLYNQYNVFTLETNNEHERIELTENPDKVVRLTDYVLMGAGGIKELAEDLIREMQERVKPNYDLRRCSGIAKQVINDFREACLEPYWGFLDKELEFMFCMTGFYTNVGTGLTTYVSGPGGGKFSEIHDPRQYFYCLISPVTDYLPLAGELFNLGGREANLYNVRQQMKAIHTIISRNHPKRVSSDMRFFILEKPKKKQKHFLKYSQKELDTKEYADPL